MSKEQEYSILAKVLFFSLALNLMFVLIGGASAFYFTYKLFEDPLQNNVSASLKGTFGDNANKIEVTK